MACWDRLVERNGAGRQEGIRDWAILGGREGINPKNIELSFPVLIFSGGIELKCVNESLHVSLS